MKLKARQTLTADESYEIQKNIKSTDDSIAEIIHDFRP